MVTIRRFVANALTPLLVGVMVLLPVSAVYAWGDEGHEIIALVTDHYLDPAVRPKVFALLASDKDALTPHDIAHEATWADKYRDSDRNTTKVRYNRTHNWHFVDIELDAPDIDAACFNHPALTTVASRGPAQDCVVDKVDEFAAELKAADTRPLERLRALKFLLHFVGDLHQPLHASDDHDAGGNQKNASASGFHAGKLHHFWDTEFVVRLGEDANTVAQNLIDHISSDQVTQWSAGTPTDWAQESFAVGRDIAYGLLPPPNQRGSYRLPPSYTDAATQAVSEQLSKAGVRLAVVLNQALAD